MKFNSTLFASACALAFVAPATAQFTVGGPGGALVDSTVNGPVDRCTTLPEVAGSFPLSSPVPSCATGITSVTLVGFSHTWAGDVQVVLTNPAGVGYNLIARPAPAAIGCTNFGYSSDFVTNYTIVAAADPYITQAWPMTATVPLTLTGGLYPQYFGEWVDGSAGVSNLDLASIPAVPGIWTLNIYDGGLGDTGSLVSWCMDGTTTAGEFLIGAGGLIPPSAPTGTGGGGTWPTALPTEPSVFPLSVAAGDCGSVIRGITIAGISHTWFGDLHVVLESPSLDRYNLIHRPGHSGTGNGWNVDLIGNTYNILDPADANINAMWPPLTPTPASIPDGNYAQYFGSWVDGTAGISNAPLSEIPVESGIWTLYVYDWAGGDHGMLAGGWAMVIGNPVTANVCDGNNNTTGVPALFSTTGSVSLAQNFAGSPTEMILHVEQLPLNVFGFFAMGNACNQTPVSQGVVCVGGSVVRGLGNQIVSTGATGTVSLPAQLYDMPNGMTGLPSGMPAVAGQRIYTQFWYRESIMGMPASNLSNALFFIVRP